MDQSRQSENIDAADVFHRIRIEHDEKYRATNDDNSDTGKWDGRDEQVEEKPMYDSRAGS
jgi:hypothetical protein